MAIKLSLSLAALMLTLTWACGRSKKTPAPTNDNRTSISATKATCPTDKGAKTDFQRDLRPTILSRCATCHGGKAPAAGVSFEGFPTSSIGVDDIWEKGFDRIVTGTMPPGGKGVEACFKRTWKSWLEARRTAFLTLDESPSEAPLNRLSKLEYSNALRDVFGTDFVVFAAQHLASVPNDDASGGFQNLKWSLGSAHLNAYNAIAMSAGEWMESDPQLHARFFPCDANGTSTRACFLTSLENLGRRLFRRPLQAGEMEFLTGLFDAAASPSEAVQDALLYLLQAPAFLYKIETSGSVVAYGKSGKSLRLDAYATAARLAFAAWKSLPDDQLLNEAKNGALETRAGYARAVARVYADGRAREALIGFFHQWLQLDRTELVSYSPDFLDGINPGTLAADMKADMSAFLSLEIFKKKSSLETLMTSRRVTLVSKTMAKIYGVPLESELGTELILPEHERSGLMTRAAIVATGHDESSPIPRGAYLRKILLCEELIPPDKARFPPGAFTPPARVEGVSMRETWERKTAPTACQSCHNRINPMGFAFEKYDGLGRFRTMDKHLASHGYESGTDIDAKVRPNIDAEDTGFVDGPVELIAHVARSQRFRLCFASNGFEYAMGRNGTPSDAVAIRKLSDAVGRSGTPLFEALQAIPSFKTFRERTLKK